MPPGLPLQALDNLDGLEHGVVEVGCNGEQVSVAHLGQVYRDLADLIHPRRANGRPFQGSCTTHHVEGGRSSCLPLLPRCLIHAPVHRVLALLMPDPKIVPRLIKGVCPDHRPLGAARGAGHHRTALEAAARKGTDHQHPTNEKVRWNRGCHGHWRQRLPGTDGGQPHTRKEVQRGDIRRKFDVEGNKTVLAPELNADIRTIATRFL